MNRAETGWALTGLHGAQSWGGVGMLTPLTACLAFSQSDTDFPFFLK